MSGAAREIVVLGGGVSGLSLAYFLRQSLRVARDAVPTKIRVLEASSSPGGWIQTAAKDDFLFEEGPRGFRPSRNGSEMLRLVEQLELQKEMRAVDAAAKARYVLRNGSVEKLPMSIKEILSWPLTPAVAKAGIHELFTAKSQLDDESIYDFISRRFSSVVADRLLDPVASGIFGGDIRHLSVRSCFQLLWDLEQQSGSVVRGMLFGKSSANDTLLDGSTKSPFVQSHENSVSVSFRSGMATLIRALEQSIQHDADSQLQLNTQVQKIHVRGDNRFQIETQDDHQPLIDATHVFSTLPAFRLAPLVQDALPQLAQTLDKIEFVSMATVHVGYRQPVLKSDGFGYLIPSCEKQRVLGAVFDSNSFPSQNAADFPLQTRLSVMCGGAHFPQITELSDQELQEIALDAVRRHLHVHETPDFVRSLVLPNAIPQYHVGFHKTLQQIEAQLAPGMRLGGNSFYGVGLADCVTRSKQLALSFAQEIGAQPKTTAIKQFSS